MVKAKNMVFVLPFFVVGVVLIAFKTIPEEHFEKLEKIENKLNGFIEDASYDRKLDSTKNQILKYLPGGIKNKKTKAVFSIVTRRLTNIRVFLWIYLCLAILAGGRGLVKRQEKIRGGGLVPPGKIQIPVASTVLFIGILSCYICSPVPIGVVVAMLMSGGAVYIMAANAICLK